MKMKPTMILPSCLLIAWRPTAMAFLAPTSPIPPKVSVAQQSSSSMPASLLHATLTADDLSTMDKADQLNILGVESEEKLALGIEPGEVLEFIGT